MNSMKRLKWVFLLSIIILTTGCWNYRELSEISIVGALGIDVVDNQFDVSVEIINAKKVATNGSVGGSAGNESTIVIYHSKAKTLKEALINMVFEAPNPLYIGHINLVLIGEEAARQGVKEFSDFLMADTDSRKIFPTVVVKGGKAIDAMQIAMPLETVTSANVKASLEAIKAVNGSLSNRLFDEILMCLYMEGRHPTASSIEIVGNQEAGSNTESLSNSIPKGSLIIDGSAVFKGDKLVGYYDTKESLGYTIIRNQAPTADLSFPCDDDDNYGNVVIDNIKSKLETNIVNNKPFAKISVTGKAALPEFNCKFDISKSKNITKVEEMVNKELKKVINNTVVKTQKEFGSDVFGFGERLFKDHNKEWQKYKKDWDQIFPTVGYKIKADIKLESIDATLKSAKGA